jgi:muramoyltetrapeptide carboxypeptidase
MQTSEILDIEHLRSHERSSSYAVRGDQDLRTGDRWEADLPPSVLPGARIGVAALSGPVDPERLERGLATLSRLGFEPVPAANLGSRTDLFAGTDDERLEGFHRLVADDSVDAVVFARGGAGVMRLLPRIDWRLLERRPRVYMGYSDLTPFLSAVVERLGLVAWHGPMVAADLARDADGWTKPLERAFLSALAGRPPEPLPVSAWLRPPGEAETVTGRLAGGCLSLLASTQGTPWAPRTDGAVLFWEDVGEPLYRVDRMLTHLELSGSLTRIRGMIVGHCRLVGASPHPSDAGDPGEAAEALRQALAEPLARFDWPVAFGVPAGHESPNLPLPLGLDVRLDPTHGAVVVSPAHTMESSEP